MTGCSTKNFFQPEKVDGYIPYEKRLPAQITSSSTVGSTMENGGVIVKYDGISKPILKQKYTLIGSGELYVIASNDKGEIHLLNKDGVELLSMDIKEKALSASFNDRETLAILTAKNEILAIDVNTKKVIFKHKEKLSLTATTDIATPVFYQDLILFPTIGGKVIVVDKNSKEIVRDFIVSTEKFFSNISHLDIFKNRVITATHDNTLSIGTGTVDNMRRDIRFILTDENNIYMFTTDGRVIVLDETLTEIGEKKFQFARFVGVSQTENALIMIEHSGFILTINKDLTNDKIYETPDDFDDYFFLDKTTLYYGRKLIDLSETVN